MNAPEIPPLDRSKNKVSLSTVTRAWCSTKCSNVSGRKTSVRLTEWLGVNWRYRMQDNQTPVDLSVSDAALSHALLRLALGTSMLAHGLVRIGGHFWPFVEQTVKQFAASPIPNSLFRISAILIPPV